MISFIIVNYRSHEELKRCLSDLAKLPDAQFFDVIIVNNDKKKVLLPRFCFGSQIIHEINENIGYARANNIGLGHASKKYICFLNPDTHSFSADLTKITEHINEKIIASPQILSDDDSVQEWSVGNEITLWQTIKNNFGFYKKPWNAVEKTSVHWVTGAALFAEKDLIQKMGGFDESFFLYFEDVDLCKRLRDMHGNILYVPTIKVKHSSGSSSKKARKIQKKCYYKSQDIFFKKHVGTTQTALLRTLRFFHR